MRLGHVEQNMRGRRRRRSTGLIMAIITSVVITGLVIVLAWAAGVQAQMSGNFAKLDEAFYAAESGVQVANWQLKHGNVTSAGWSSTISIAVSANGTTYTYANTVNIDPPVDNTLLITSTSTLNNSDVRYVCMQNAVMAYRVAATTGAGTFENKNLDITGDLMVFGDYTNAASGSVTGNLTYYGTATGTGNVSGTVTHDTDASHYPQIDFATIESKLVPTGTYTYNTSQSGTTFNFNNVSGTNKVISVNGNVTNPTFIGSGTLYATGDITLDSNWGSSGSPVNIVAKGNVDSSSNNLTIYGSVYTNGTWTRNKINMTGLIYAHLGMIAPHNPSSSLTLGTQPWFDPRTASVSTATYSFSNFADSNP